jgi:hypothetical protein
MNRSLLASAVVIFVAFGAQVGAYQGLRNTTSEDTPILAASFNKRFEVVTVSRGQRIVAGVTPQNDIFLMTNDDGDWKDVSNGKSFKSVSVTGNSKLLWGVDTSGNTWYLDYNSWEGWKRFSSSRKMKQIVATDDERMLMGLEDTDGPYKVYLSSDGKNENWRSLGYTYGTVTSIAITGDGKTMYVTAGGSLLRRVGNNWSADLSNENMNDVAITSSGKMVGVSRRSQRVWYCDSIPCGKKWYADKSNGKFKQVTISPDAKYIWGTSPEDRVYFKTSGTNPSIAAWRPL